MPVYVNEKTDSSRFVLGPAAGAAVSGMYAAAFVGQYAQVADAFVPGNMPATGIFMASVPSGSPVEVQQYGRLSNAAYSGLFTSGSPVYVGSGGFPTPTTPQTSGSTVQRLGYADTATSLILSPDPTYFLINV